MMQYYHTQTINQDGCLTIGGIDVYTLKERFGTPLYIMDEMHIRKQCQWFQRYFKKTGVDTEVIYASKAFMTIAMAKLIQQEGLSLDVVSGGELYTAYKAGYPMAKVYFHGNNKSLKELQMALDYGVGTIVLDNVFEYHRLVDLIEDTQSINVLLRVNPGIEAHTHEYIATTKNNSKFGMSIFDDNTLSFIETITKHPNIKFTGLHSHIGSQIFEESSFIDHANAIMAYVVKLKTSKNIVVESINLGGGFGVQYTKEDRPINSLNFLKNMLEVIETSAKSLDVKTPKVMIEPGRAIVANSGITLYEVGNAKTVHSKKRYCFVDGSMADHIRTALYQADYHCVLANRMKDPHNTEYTVTGKACESGDIIIRTAYLPKPNPKDLLVVFSTGAYHYSMASNYNRLLKPPVIFVKDGEAKVVVKGETFEDLIQNDQDVTL